eukprot:TRINITY_DN1395_c0_g4_i1.p1 TRINITY_DN1395_c0_g4~~TRINITY_DN1395_c0_g4_i1.p1  ORF type:complete len:703 (+),score=134.11 TRINITY_DN1395_c0_g4_i1:79-2109(+)
MSDPAAAEGAPRHGRSKSSVRRANDMRALVGADLLDVNDGVGGEDLIAPQRRPVPLSAHNLAASADERRPPAADGTSSPATALSSSGRKGSGGSSARSSRGGGAEVRQLFGGPGVGSVRNAVEAAHAARERGRAAAVRSSSSTHDRVTVLRGGTERSSTTTAGGRSPHTSQLELGDSRREPLERSRASASGRADAHPVPGHGSTDPRRQQQQQQWESEREALVGAMRSQGRELKRLEEAEQAARRDAEKLRQAAAAAERSAQEQRAAALSEAEGLRRRCAAAEARAEAERLRADRAEAAASSLRIRMRAAAALHLRHAARLDHKHVCTLERAAAAECDAAVARSEVQLLEETLASERDELDAVRRELGEEADASERLADAERELEETRAQLTEVQGEREALWEECERLTAELHAARDRAQMASPTSERAPHANSGSAAPLPLQPVASPGTPLNAAPPGSGSSACGSGAAGLCTPAAAAPDEQSPLRNRQRAPASAPPATRSNSGSSPRSNGSGSSRCAPAQSSSLQGQRSHFGFKPRLSQIAIGRRFSEGAGDSRRPTVPALSFSSPVLQPDGGDPTGGRALTARQHPSRQNSDDTPPTARSALARRRALQEARDARKSAAAAAAAAAGTGAEAEGTAAAGGAQAAMSAQFDSIIQEVGAMRTRGSPTAPQPGPQT